MAAAAQTTMAQAPVRTRGAKRNWLAVIGVALVAIFIVFALFAPWIAPQDPAHIELAARLQPPSLTHLCGTDELGRDILSRLIYGARISMLEELGQDYIRTARAKGLPERTVVYRHALRNAMIPVLTVVGLQFGALLAGAIVTETIFSWPGIGRLTIQAISNRDYYLVEGCILAIGLTYVAVNFLTDLLYSVVNPRIRQ